MNDGPARRPDLLKDGLEIPGDRTQIEIHFCIEHPLWALIRRAWLPPGLGESEMLDLFHIARSFAEKRCPWLLSLPNKALATVPAALRDSPSKRDGRPFSGSPNFVLNTKGRAFRRLTTIIERRLWAAFVDGVTDVPAPRVRNTALEVARSSITPGHLGTRRCQSKRTRTRGCWPPPVRCSTFCTKCLGHEGPKMAIERDTG